MESNASFVRQNDRLIGAITINHCWLLIGISLALRLLWISLNGLLVEEAYYWNYAQHLDFSYYDHPPMVAVMIKLSTLVFGLNEFSVHFPALFCWVVTAIYLFKLTEIMAVGAGRYAVMLYSLLPYFFLQSMVTMPDTAVMVCWSAALYYLYRVLILNEARSWYAVGVCLGLGMLSKYTIVLLALPILGYLLLVPSQRSWFFRKEPYLAVLIGLLLFTPVIYWNATHEWASFMFQSVRRFKSPSSFSLPLLVGLLGLFITPVGGAGLWRLLWSNSLDASLLEGRALRFLQYFTWLPLGFFVVYSVRHAVKIDWIGPGLISILPWFAVLIKNAAISGKNKLLSQWVFTAVVLLFFYAGLILMTTTGLSGKVHEKLLHHYFSWGELTKELNAVASQVEAETNQAPLLSPLDTYHIGSELLFYQALLSAQRLISKPYAVVGNQLFGGNSLMYQYWTNGDNLAGKRLILISDHLQDFNYGLIRELTVEKSPIRVIWSYSQRGHQPVIPIYYRIVEVKHNITLTS